MRSFALAASGRDRPGIVAEVTRALLEHGVNIEDAEMAILRGHFSIVLVLAADDGVDEASLRAALEQVREAVPLEALSFLEVETVGAAPAAATHALSVYGADRPGIVHGVADALASHGVNIVGLTTRVVENRLYVMLLEVAVPSDLRTSAGELLEAVAAELGVDVSVRELDADVL